MELIFIRHGEGEHTLNTPNSLQTFDPILTDKGINQAKLLRTQFSLSKEDILVISPLRRALLTAHYWSKGINCKKTVNPLVSPRIFPQVSEGRTLPCDRLLDRQKISVDFPNIQIEEKLPEEFWANGINILPQEDFNYLAKQFLEWCKQQETPKIYIISHDGTITSYRQFITGDKLTRDDFPKETGWVNLKF
ncbi:histidine phosphatase family protein [Halalkalibacter akibai]|uniref:Phosphoglycerate mutase n=1 Tax=Halalkalibacter akibai (strain ATCC 43226 / DSM 21942 / CIP 109018 / JCM 9157 / 1139) TaxID=1236973 RepID=W4QWJ1_HALA3|nr:histidine phosphatase family protein [Halalkalibacter akibai]GAE36446.1 phosphoglycerate mutase [Halalkalibacter akibai JCM 9157]